MLDQNNMPHTLASREAGHKAGLVGLGWKNKRSTQPEVVCEWVLLGAVVLGMAAA